MLSELFTSVSAKVAAASFAAVTTVGTGAAAATGHLPGEMQDGIATAAESVGLDLPDSAEDAERQDESNRQDGDAATQNRQDGENRQDENQNGESTDTDELFETLTGEEGTTPEDGDEFGDAVSTNASENGEEFGSDVAGTASDERADQDTTSNDASTTGDDDSTTGDDAAADESDASESEYPDDAPSDSGEQDNAESDGDNPSSDHRPGS